MDIDDNEIRVAYRKLKQLVYYDKTDLSLRKRLAEFECATSFEKKLSKVYEVINSEDPLGHSAFKRWLNEIDFRVVPKQIESLNSTNANSEPSDGKFISNVTSAESFKIVKVNYFFDGPIQLHLIAVLWVMREGRLLDAQLGPECCGSRLAASLADADDQSPALFQRYHEQYSRWRDSGIRKAKQLLAEDGTSVGILGLDIQEYFYHIQLNIPAMVRAIDKASGDKKKGKKQKQESKLLTCLNAIHNAYQTKIFPFLQITHKHLANIDTGIPIGLCSSPVIANWHLQEFDESIKASVRPAYYGRYVDDILLVVATHDDPSQGKKDPVDVFIGEVLVKNGILRKVQNKRYETLRPNGLFLQQSKCILQFFDSSHSIAGLEKFQKKLEENGSDFLLMPVDESDHSLEDVAYELLYEGSVNKFRSVKGVAENKYELAKYLARQAIVHLLTDDPPEFKWSLGLRRFFKGKCAIEYFDIWERVFTLFFIARDSKAANAFEKSLLLEINRVQYLNEPTITDRLLSGLKTHLRLSREMAHALGPCEVAADDSETSSTRKKFRRSNLLRHHFVRRPLLNYTNYLGELTSSMVNEIVKLDPRMLEFSPRYVNFDECLMLADSNNVRRENLSSFEWASDLYTKINRYEIQDVEWMIQSSVEG